MPDQESAFAATRWDYSVPLTLIEQLAVATRDLLHVSEKAAKLVGPQGMATDLDELRDVQERLSNLHEEVHTAQGALRDWRRRN
jgi:hypothetical protein